MIGASRRGAWVRAIQSNAAHTMKVSWPGSRVAQTVILREVELDLHAGGQADGEPGSSISLVMPKDWRDVPHSRDKPPFWVLPWPSGSALAAQVLKEPLLVRDKRIIDMGCGLAPAGIAAALAGASHVVLADCDEHALHCARRGALANAVHDVCSTLELDWHDEPEETLVGAFDVVLASDLFYEDDSLEPLSRLLPKLVRPGGTLLCCLPVESEFRRASQASNKAAESSVRRLRGAGFDVGSIIESRGAQLPGMGPEGLAAARRVVLATMLRRSGPEEEKVGAPASKEGADQQPSGVVGHVSAVLDRLAGSER